MKTTNVYGAEEEQVGDLLNVSSSPNPPLGGQSAKRPLDWHTTAVAVPPAYTSQIDDVVQELIPANPPLGQQAIDTATPTQNEVVDILSSHGGGGGKGTSTNEHIANTLNAMGLKPSQATPTTPFTLEDSINNFKTIDGIEDSINKFKSVDGIEDSINKFKSVGSSVEDLSKLKEIHPELEDVPVENISEALEVIAADKRTEDARIGEVRVIGEDPNRTYTLEAVNNDPELLKRSVSGSVVPPELAANMSKNFEATASILGKMTQEGMLDPSLADAIVKAESDYALALDPENEAGLVYNYLEKSKEINNKIGDIRGELNDLRDKEIDPDKYFNTLPKAQQLTSILSRTVMNINKMAGTIPQGASGFADFIDAQIAQDVKLQMEEIRSQREGLSMEANLLGEELKNAKSDVEASISYRVKAIEGAKAKINTLAQQQKLSAEAKYGAKLAVLGLEEKQNNMLLQMFTQNYNEEYGMPVGGGMTPEQQKMVVDEQNSLEGRVISVPVYDENGKQVTDENGIAVLIPRVAPRGSESSSDKIRGRVESSQNLIRKINELQDMVDGRGYATNLFPTERKKISKTLATQLSLELQKFYELGVLTEGDKEVHREMLGDPAKWISIKGNQSAQLASLRGNLIRDMQNSVISHAPQTFSEYVDTSYPVGSVYHTMPRKEYYLGLEEKGKQYFTGTSAKSQSNATMQDIDAQGVTQDPEGIEYTSSLGRLGGGGGDNEKGIFGRSIDFLYR